MDPPTKYNSSGIYQCKTNKTDTNSTLPGVVGLDKQATKLFELCKSDDLPYPPDAGGAASVTAPVTSPVTAPVTGGIQGMRNMGIIEGYNESYTWCPADKLQADDLWDCNEECCHQSLCQT